MQDRRKESSPENGKKGGRPITKERILLFEAGLKKCSVCKEVKDFSQFTRDRKHKNGMSSQCKACQKKRFELFWKRKTINIDEIAGLDAPMIHPSLIPKECVQDFDEKTMRWRIRKEGHRTYLPLVVMHCENCNVDLLQL